MALALGVNLAGGDFGSNVPGVLGKDYFYPTHANIDYYAEKGIDVIRLPFLWERIQSAQFGSLNATDLAKIDDIVNYAAAKGIVVDLDMHGYGKYYGQLIGSVVPNAAFADVWGKLAAHFVGDSNVIFGIQNEPNIQSATQWITSVNAAIAAIRSAGATQEILVPGTYWDGAWTWVSSDNDTVIGTGVKDPLKNYAFELHSYLDSDGSGTHQNVVSTTVGVDRLIAATQWAEATGNKLFLGEFGVNSDATSLTALNNMMAYLEAHPVWQGATYWAGGGGWGGYWMALDPINGQDTAQMNVLENFLTPGAQWDGGTVTPPPPTDHPGTLTEPSNQSGFLVGATVTAHLSDPDGVQSGSAHYQWLLDGQPIPGATLDTFILPAADVGHQIQATVTYTDGLGFHDAVNASPFLVSDGSVPPPPVTGLHLVGTNAYFDKLVGGSIGDLIEGNPTANNVLLGNGGNDVIVGGHNTNWIDGGSGSDNLSANGGRTTFVESAHNSNGDVIQGFKPGVNHIEAPGYGSTGKLTQIDATHWQLSNASGTIHDVITLANGVIIHPSDIHFS